MWCSKCGPNRLATQGNLCWDCAVAANDAAKDAHIVQLNAEVERLRKVICTLEADAVRHRAERDDARKVADAAKPQIREIKRRTAEEIARLKVAMPTHEQLWFAHLCVSLRNTDGSAEASLQRSTLDWLENIEDTDDDKESE